MSETEEIRLLKEQNAMLRQLLDAAKSVSKAPPITPTQTRFAMLQREASCSRMVDVSADEYARRMGIHNFKNDLPPGNYVVMGR